jgi:thymidylate synthase
LTTKTIFFRGIVEELLWMLRGSTNAKELSEKGVKIWDGHSSRAYLDSVGLNHLPEGDIGAGYGFQLRHFGAKYIDCNADYAGQGVDQLADVIHKIRTNPTDRRIMFSLWNPTDLKSVALPACHVLYQFYVHCNGDLSCHMYQRSADVGLGLPFNIASAALLTYMLAHMCGKTPLQLTISLGDAHVYRNQITALNEQIERKPRPFPTLKFTRPIESINDFKTEDIVLMNYLPHSAIKMEMAI